MGVMIFKLLTCWAGNKVLFALIIITKQIQAEKIIIWAFSGEKIGNRAYINL